MSTPCPICHKPSTKPYTPFCCKRCADIDLGKWLGEHYSVPGEETPSSTLEETAQD